MNYDILLLTPLFLVVVGLWIDLIQHRKDATQLFESVDKRPRTNK